jgi:hypothetical protein
MLKKLTSLICLGSTCNLTAGLFVAEWQLILSELISVGNKIWDVSNRVFYWISNYNYNRTEKTRKKPELRITVHSIRGGEKQLTRTLKWERQNSIRAVFGCSPWTDTGITRLAGILHRERKGGGGFTDPLIFNLGTKWGGWVIFTPRQLYHWRKILRDPMNRKLGQPQSQTGGLRYYTNRLPLLKIDPGFVGRSVCCLVIVSTEPSALVCFKVPIFPTLKLYRNNAKCSGCTQRGLPFLFIIMPIDTTHA